MPPHKHILAYTYTKCSKIGAILLKTSAGFTLIELIIVIVLLAILSAVALPRFFSASTDARTAVIKHMEDAIYASRNFAKGRYRLDGLTGTGTVTIDGQSITVLSGGFPTGDSAGIGSALESISGFDVAYAAGVATFTITGYAGSNCQVTYTASTGAATKTINGC